MEPEKTLIWQRLDETKQYIAAKLLTSLKLLPHVAGMSGKKADKMLVKACAQFVLGRLAARRDVDGMAAFARDLYDVVNVELRADAIAQQRVDALCGRIDDAAEDLDTVISGKVPDLDVATVAPRVACVSGFDVIVGGGDDGDSNSSGGSNSPSVSSIKGGKGSKGGKGGDMVSRVPVRVGRDPNYIVLSSVKRFVTRRELYDRAADSRKAREELRVFDAADEQERVRKLHGGLGLIPAKWMTSEEKVGDVEKPVTVATKRALTNCKRRGAAKYSAASFVDVRRSTRVQIGVPLSKGLAVVLHCSEHERWRTRRLERARRRLGAAVWKREKARGDRALVRAGAKREAVGRLTVTGMQVEFLASPADRWCLTERERAIIAEQITYIAEQTKIV